MNRVLRTVPTSSQKYPHTTTTGYAGKPSLLFLLLNSHMSFKIQLDVFSRSSQPPLSISDFQRPGADHGPLCERTDLIQYQPPVSSSRPSSSTALLDKGPVNTT